MNGFITDVNNPNITSSRSISEGFYLFPAAKFRCSGRILGLQSRATFDGSPDPTNYYYNETLVLSLQLWKEEQGHYVAPLQNHSVSVSTEQLGTVRASTAFDGLFVFDRDQTLTFPIRVEEAIEVKSGDVLAVSVPPRTKSSPGNWNVINGIPLLIANGPGTFLQNSTSCWSPQGRTVCYSMQPLTVVPWLTFEFQHSPDGTG